MPELIGRTLGQYKIIEQIGEGGMATVYKAYQAGLERYVALKVLSPLRAREADFSTRFRREAKAIAALHHPNILPVYDFGHEGEYHFLAMRYIAGAKTLYDLMKEPLPPSQMSELISQVAAALDTAHSQGVIHRDVKPSNILLDGTWALLGDFGLVKLSEESSKLTGSGVGLGTPAYISPEQGQGEQVDHRTDIYSLGVILFEMLTRQIPHDADTPFAIILKRVSEPMPSAQALNPDISEAVEAVLQKALATEPSERYESAGALAGAFKQAISGPASSEIGAAPIPATKAEPTYRIRLFGPLQVEKAGQPLPPFAPKKVRPC